jgi:hypothetical protein
MINDTDIDRHWELIVKAIYGELNLEEHNELQELDDKAMRKTLSCNTKSTCLSEDDFAKSEY